MIPWKTANMMYMESLLRVKRIIPLYALGQAFSPGEKERWPAVLLPSLRACCQSEEALLDVLPSEYFTEDLYDLSIRISLAKLRDAMSSAKGDCCLNTVTERVTLQADFPGVCLSLWDLGC